jgi:hypothetical protein
MRSTESLLLQLESCLSLGVHTGHCHWLLAGACREETRPIKLRGVFGCKLSTKSYLSHIQARKAKATGAVEAADELVQVAIV